MNLEELLNSKTPPKRDDLTDEDLARFFIKYKGLLKKLERDEAFGAATNENIKRAYSKLDELVEERTIELKMVNEQLQQELTERKKADDLLKESEEKYRSLVETTNDWIWEVDENGVYTYCSPKIKDILGYNIEEVIGKTPFDFMPSIEAERVFDLFNGALQSNQPIISLENKNLHKNGYLITLETSGVPFFNAEGKLLGYRGIDRDITERKKAEDAIKESEAKFRGVFESKLIGTIFWDAKGEITDANKAFLDMVGYTKDEVLKGIVRWKDMTPSEYLERDEKLLKELATVGYIAPIEKEYYHKDGHRIPTILGAATLQGSSVSGVAFILDITERKKVEQKLKATLEDLQRSNTELEEFAYVASHDLQEPLRMVASFTQLLQKRYQDKLDDEANEFITFAVDGATRMQSLINDLLTYSRVGIKGASFSPTDMNVILEDVLTNIQQTTLEADAKITTDPLPVIIADKSQMAQILQNLISNAIKFRGKSSINIHVSGENQPDEWIFSVKDNGIGIDPKYFERIFIIFQRLHKRDEYEGTGIGLAVSKKIIQRHRGKIWVESELGKGSTFYFSIPKKKIRYFEN